MAFTTEDRTTETSFLEVEAPLFLSLVPKKSTIVAPSSDVLETARACSEQKLQCLVFGVIFYHHVRRHAHY